MTSPQQPAFTPRAPQTPQPGQSSSTGNNTQDPAETAQPSVVQVLSTEERAEIQQDPRIQEIVDLFQGSIEGICIDVAEIAQQKQASETSESNNDSAE